MPKLEQSLTFWERKILGKCIPKVDLLTSSKCWLSVCPACAIAAVKNSICSSSSTALPSLRCTTAVTMGCWAMSNTANPAPFTCACIYLD